jgi:DNA-binding beta-propeller fold protein YncE
MGRRRPILATLAGVVSIAVAPAFAAAASAVDLGLPPGFTAQVYVTGEGFDTGSQRVIGGIPAAGTLGFDQTGALFLAKTGARFRSGEVEDLWPIYRFPPGGGRFTPDTESRYLHGPPLKNALVGTVRGRGEVFVTTYDRDRRLGALYRMLDGRPTLFAGGTPAPGGVPLFRMPESVAVDAAGHVYVTDREQGVVIRLHPTGAVRDPAYVRVPRPRMLAVDEGGQLWVAGDGSAETPWQDGAGQIWKVTPDGTPSLVLQGPLPAGISLSPGGALFVAQRRTGQVFLLSPEGKRIELFGAPSGTMLRGLAFAPVTPETRRAGIAGDLFVIAVAREAWTINEVIRISGPFDQFARQSSP